MIILGRKSNADRAVTTSVEAPETSPQSGAIESGKAPQKLPAKFWIALFWFVSTGLHSVLFLLPMPSSEPPIGEKPVKIVQLSRPKLPVAQRKPALAVAQPAQPKPTVAAKVETPRSPALEVKQPAPQAPESEPQPQPQPTPAATNSAVAPSPTLPVQPTSEVSSPPPPSQPNTQPPPDTMTAIAQSAGGARCDEATADCYRIPINPGTSWRSLASEKAQKFEQQGYQVKQLEDLDDDTGLLVYELSKNGTTEFLHASSSEASVLFLKRPKLLTKEQVDQSASGNS